MLTIYYAKIILGTITALNLYYPLTISAKKK